MRLYIPPDSILWLSNDLPHVHASFTVVTPQHATLISTEKHYTSKLYAIYVIIYSSFPDKTN
jgi:hypothetical protein